LPIVKEPGSYCEKCGSLIINSWLAFIKIKPILLKANEI